MRGAFFFLCLAFLGIALPALPVSAGSAPQWEVLPVNSRIDWTLASPPREDSGAFPNVSAHLSFDPDKPKDSHANGFVSIACIRSEDGADAATAFGRWLKATLWPRLYFDARSFSKAENGGYRAEGLVWLRGRPVPFSAPFSVRFYDELDATPPMRYARFILHATLSRAAIPADRDAPDFPAEALEITMRLEARRLL
jgi:polyisoprenoid-binding protein YceI